MFGWLQLVLKGHTCQPNGLDHQSRYRHAQTGQKASKCRLRTTKYNIGNSGDQSITQQKTEDNYPSFFATVLVNNAICESFNTSRHRAEIYIRNDHSKSKPDHSRPAPNPKCRWRQKNTGQNYVAEQARDNAVVICELIVYGQIGSVLGSFGRPIWMLIHDLLLAVRSYSSRPARMAIRII